MDLYQQNILDHYKNPRHHGLLPNATGRGEASNLACGDAVNFQVKLAKDKITAIAWSGQGCVLSQAAASLLAENVIGKKREMVSKYNNETMIKLLEITPGPNRLRCALLSLDALKKALQICG
ncbi:MAG: iron-sulfur cluster assembly scaffold protein [Candidatus Kerfeldbacteria bacterium]|nr:iron-sulfur cluster assembly scaffold protein [Candidatus Kerfeldbacteria bacterium]